MRILLTNDDGIEAEGMAALVRALAPRHTLVVAAPSVEQSGTAHALTVHRDIEAVRYEGFGGIVYEAWGIDGTPTDCVKIYLEAIAEREDWPELVVSGVNYGENLGTDVLYSGTVGGALEGYLHGVSSVALSLGKSSRLTAARAAEIFARHLPWFFSQSHEAFFFNVNFPRELRHEPPDFAWAKLGHRDYVNAFDRIERDGRLYYHIGGEIFDWGNDDTTDIGLVGQGYITVTPLATNMTDFAFLRGRGLSAQANEMRLVESR